MTATQLNQGRRPLPARPAVRRRLRLHLRHVRPAGQVADGRRLEPHRRGHRTDGGRRVGDGHLRHHRQARTGSARPSQHRKTVIAYGLVPIAGAQLCYYNAVAHLSVGVALLLEYTAPVLVVGWLWATTRRRPTNLTLAGVALAVAGIMLVLDVFAGAHINATGVAWGLAAAVCAACYFMMSDEVSRRRQRAELDHARRGRTDRRRGRGRPARRVRRDAADLHHQRHRHRGVDDVLGGARRRARRDHHGDRLHAGHHGHRPAAAAVRLAGRAGRGDVRRAGGVGCCSARRSR